mmetsp:Transcript_8181/g.12417  ORF Transcript_8181/g.12417 Transcript_8181/m.12417 type:complete len:201 (-) Transcript_8181:279-881(-)
MCGRGCASQRLVPSSSFTVAATGSLIDVGVGSLQSSINIAGSSCNCSNVKGDVAPIVDGDNATSSAGADNFRLATISAASASCCVPCVVVSDAALQASALCGKSHASAVCGPLHSDFKELCCNSCPTSHWAIVRSTDWARGVESSGSKFGAGSLGLGLSCRHVSICCSSCSCCARRSVKRLICSCICATCAASSRRQASS